MKSLIPNTITTLNLLCGLLGIVFAFNEMLAFSGLMILLAAVFDFFDGFAARLLKAKSNIGKDLDSLADIVSFGVLPGLMLYQFIVISSYQFYVPFTERPLAMHFLAGTAFVLPIFSAIRLAIFNQDDSQSAEFKGLATPAAAIFVASIALIMGFQLPVNMYYPPQGQALSYTMAMFYQDAYDLFLFRTVFNPYTHVFVSFGLAFMLLIKTPMFSLKFKGFGWKLNRTRYLFLIFATLLLFYSFAHYFFIVPGSITLEYSSFAWLILTYIILSFINSLFKRNEIQSGN